jgi:hypothetical protein
MATFTPFYCLIPVMAFAPLLCAQQATLIRFEMRDQFDSVYSDAEYRGRSLLLSLSDQKGSQFCPVWDRALNARLGEGWRSRTSEVLAAEVTGVPRLLHGMVKGMFPQQRDKAVVLDWDGRFAKAYGFHKDECALLVFDPAGRLLHRAGGQQPRAEQVEQLANAVRTSQTGGP